MLRAPLVFSCLLVTTACKEPASVVDTATSMKPKPAPATQPATNRAPEDACHDTSPGDELQSFAPERVTMVHFGYSKPGIHVLAVQWRDGGPLWVNVEREDGKHRRFRARADFLKLLDAISTTRVKRVVGDLDRFDRATLTKYGFPGPHASTGYFTVDFSMEPGSFHLGTIDPQKKEIYTVSGGCLVAMESAPFQRLMELR